MKTSLRSLAPSLSISLLAGLAGLAAVGCSSSDSPGVQPPATGGAGSACPAGRNACGPACVDLTSDFANCGACNAACGAGQQCTSGVCACAAPLTSCGAACSNLLGDGQNCGACGNVCAPGSVCSNGVCSTSCTVPGQTQCGTSCVDLATDVANCGQCSVACLGGSCVGGVCSCAAGQQLCNGLCIDVTANNANCGACGVACGGGTTCTGGVCVAVGTGGTGSGGACGAGTTCTGGTTSGGTGGVSGGTGGVSGGTGGSGGDCTNIRPTGTEWDAATCDMWASQTSECSAAWMIDNNYCNQSCGRCSGGTGGAGGSGGTGGVGGSTGGSGGGSTCTQPDSQVCASNNSNNVGTHCGLTFEIWTDSSNSCMTNTADGFHASWTQANGNYLARKGVRPGSTDPVVTYSANYQPNGNSYLAIYGWTQNPLIEYYIVDSWGDWRPPGTNAIGTVQVDGGTYDIYQSLRENKPSIEGNKTFYQYWSVRTQKRTSGTITVGPHFEAWQQFGLQMGTFYEVSLVIEGYQSSGSADVTVSFR